MAGATNPLQSFSLAGAAGTNPSVSVQALGSMSGPFSPPVLARLKSRSGESSESGHSTPSLGSPNAADADKAARRALDAIPFGRTSVMVNVDLGYRPPHHTQTFSPTVGARQAFEATLAMREQAAKAQAALSQQSSASMSEGVAPLLSADGSKLVSDDTALVDDKKAVEKNVEGKKV